MTALKPRFPRAAAVAVARQICLALQPVTERLVVAGSLRRMKAEVGDVEILYIPKMTWRPAGLFDQEPVNLADDVIAVLENSGVLARRLNVRGSETFGAKNKLMLHQASSIPVDLFSATVENWFNYLVCRTGPADSNTRIAAAAQARGWKWNPYGSGFTGPDRTRAMGSEREVFEFVGLPYLEPQHRR